MKREKSLKLGIVGTVGVPAKYGGCETLVHQLVTHLNQRMDITVYCSGKQYPKEEQVGEWNGARLKYVPLQANGSQSIVYDLISMIHALLYCDVLLILGVSGCMFLPVIKYFTKKKVIVNIDGLEWRRPKWGRFAKSFLLKSEKMACLYADQIITDNRILKAYAEIRYGIQATLIEYGADHNQPIACTPQNERLYDFLSKPYAFKVARIEPENHIHLILNAFAPTPSQTLVLVGNWQNSSYGRNLFEEYDKHPNLYLLDPIYEPQILNLLRSNAAYYVHGHSAGGTNPSLVEAMYLNLPVLSFDVIYNRVTTNNQAIFFDNEESLKVLIRNIDKQPLRAVADNLKAYADKQYTWNNISARYAHLIEGSIGEPNIQYKPSNYQTMPKIQTKEAILYPKAIINNRKRHEKTYYSSWDLVY